jgi:hypothetical protein|nr:MAG TPA: hypothetical protein [Caudoviricetes sp.]DAY07493.1 MAG TPA: hypothetical protein [Caudoviricetes sp.]
MKKINFNDVNVKEEIANIANDILKLNVEKTKTFIKIGDDGELNLEDNFSENVLVGLPLELVEGYLKVEISDIRPANEYIESQMDIDYDDEEYVESPEYQEEYKEIYDEMIEDEYPYILQNINEAIECYNDNLQNQD